MSKTLYRISAFLLPAVNVSMSGYFRHLAEDRGGRVRTPEGKGTVVVLRVLGLAVVLPLLGYLINPRWFAGARVPLPGKVRAAGPAGAAGTVPLLYATLNALGDNISLPRPRARATAWSHMAPTAGYATPCMPWHRSSPSRWRCLPRCGGWPEG